LSDKLPKRLKTSRFASMSPLVDRMLKSVQHISSELRPPILDDLGLEAAIEWHAQEFVEWSGCRCALELRLGVLPRNRDRDITVFRILQESLTNVARHAQASNVIVRAWVSDSDVTLQVSDNGVGFSLSKLSSPTSLGISGMRERADALGGTVQFDSDPQQGSTVTLRLPLIETEIMEAAWS
jgi:signal transduction histidine kinase